MVKVNITIPVYNEEESLSQKIQELIAFLNKTKFPHKYEIIIADNASTDNTGKIAKKLVKKYPLVKYIRIDKKGRGLALKTVWTKTNADVLSYMDVDLSTDLKHFKPLIDSIVVSKNNLAIGNRLGKNSKVIGRSFLRELLSRGYNLILRLIFFSPINDSQCGFKAIDRKSFLKLVKEIEDNNWFLDTEMILLALHRGMKVSQIDVKWIDDPGSQVKIVKTVSEDLHGVARVKRKFISEMFK